MAEGTAQGSYQLQAGPDREGEWGRGGREGQLGLLLAPTSPWQVWLAHLRTIPVSLRVLCHPVESRDRLVRSSDCIEL